jgi:putative effector of murein hydrolase LrgA (UPF0299 family)
VQQAQNVAIVSRLRKMKPKEIARWAAVLAFGGFGLWNVSDSVALLSRTVAERDWVMVIFDLTFTGVFIGLPLLISYFAFRRQYRRITAVVAAIAALVVGSILISIPSKVGLHEFMTQHLQEEPWLVLIALPLSLLCLFGPFYAAGWFYRFCLRLYDRFIDDRNEACKS